jgi:hypothetical protein
MQFTGRQVGVLSANDPAAMAGRRQFCNTAGDLALNLGEYCDTKPSMRRDIILQHGVNFNRENST